MKRRHAIPAVLTALVLAVSGACSNSEDDAGGEGELRKVTFRGPFVTSGGDAPFYFARELGYYEDAGIDLEILDSKSSVQTVDDVATGGVEFGEADGTAVMLAAGADRPVVAVASTVGRSSFGFFVADDSGITEPEELAGATVAAIPTVESSMIAALNAAGLSRDDVEPVFADSNALITTYLGGQVDALYTTALLRGAVMQRPSSMILQSDMGYNPPDFALIVHPDLLEEDPELVRSFVEATLKGFQAAREDPEAAIAALLDAHPELDPDPAAGVLAAVTEFLCSDAQSEMPYGRNAEEDWTVAATALQEYAGLEGAPEAERFMTNELFDEGAGLDAGDC